MERPPNLDAARHWLACYVMLSRAKSVDGFLELPPATRKDLSARPPRYLLDELDRLQKMEDKSLQELLDYIKDLNLEVPPVIAEGVLHRDAATNEEERVAAHRFPNLKRPSADLPGSVNQAQVVPKRRLFQKTAPNSDGASLQPSVSQNAVPHGSGTVASSVDEQSHKS